MEQNSLIMKQILVITLLCITTPALAQEVYLGLSAGPAKRFDANKPKATRSLNIIEKGVFVRVNTNRKLSFIGSIHHYGRTVVENNPYFAHIRIDYLKDRFDYLEYRYGIEYSLTPKRLHDKVGINQYAGIQLAHRNYYNTVRYELGDGLNNVASEQYFAVLGGLTYTVTYNIGKLHLGINTSAMLGHNDFRHDPWGRDELIRPSSILSANLRIGYRIN